MYWKNLDKIWVIVTHLAAAFLGAFLISFLFVDDVQYQDQKLYQLLDIIENRFVEDANTTTLEDVAAYAMVKATGDQWSYYIPGIPTSGPCGEYGKYLCGCGSHQVSKDDGSGLEVTELTEGGGAAEAGIQLHDVLIRVDGKSCAGIELKEVTPWIRGEEGSTVVLTVNRNGQELDFTVTRKRVEIPVATYEMLPSAMDSSPLRTLKPELSEETLEAIDALMEQGAKGLIFDVRFNPGGYTTELVKILDYLLPKDPCSEGRVTMVRPVWITPMPSAWIYPWPCWPTSRPIPLRSSLLPPCKNMTRLWWWANKPLGRDIIKIPFG